MNTTNTSQQGFLMIIAVMLIVVVAAMSLALVYLFTSNNYNLAQTISAKQALYYSETGLELAAFAMYMPNLNQRHACTHFSRIIRDNDANVLELSNAHPNQRVYAAHSRIRRLQTHRIRLYDTSDFAPSGRIYVNQEAIDYQRINGTYLEEITRGAGGTIPSNRISVGDDVSQFQCYISAHTKVPEQHTLGQRTLTGGIILQRLWILGQKRAAGQWNNNGELRWHTVNLPSRQVDIHGVSLLHPGLGWAVGNKDRDDVSIWYWSPPATWQNADVRLDLNRDLHDVVAASRGSAWAVGQRKDDAFTLLQWQGGQKNNWCIVPTAGAGRQHDRCRGLQIRTDKPDNARDLYAVAAVDLNKDDHSDLAFAVGGSNREFVLLQYTGHRGEWHDAKTAFPRDRVAAIYGVTITAPIRSQTNIDQIEAWAVAAERRGNDGKILRRIPGGTWRIHSDSSQVLRDIAVIDETGDGLANYGWAVGDNGAAYYFDNGQWRRFNLGRNDDLKSVVVWSRNDAWLVGNNGLAMHWDGNDWSVQLYDRNKSLNAIALTAARHNALATWHES